jgi:hypothetical protein
MEMSPNASATATTPPGCKAIGAVELRGQQGGDLRGKSTGGEGRRERLEVARQRRAARSGGAFDRDRRGDERITGRGQRTEFEHVIDRREARVAHGFKALDLVGKDADQLAVDVERAAAHAGDGAHQLDPRVGEFAEDHALARPERVAEHAGDLDREGLGVAALEDGPDLALHARLQLVQRENGGVLRLGKQPHREGHEEQEAKEGNSADHGWLRVRRELRG